MKPSLPWNNEKHDAVKPPSGTKMEDIAFMGQISYEAIVELNNSQPGEGVMEPAAPREDYRELAA